MNKCDMCIALVHFLMILAKAVNMIHDFHTLEGKRLSVSSVSGTIVSFPTETSVLSLCTLDLVTIRLHFWN